MSDIGAPTSSVPAIVETAATTRYSNHDETEDFGDVVSDEDDIADLEFAAEPLHKYDLQYTPHVFYPVRLGDVINKRYLVEHKLGFGGFSTVWMAHDLQEKWDVAIKILIAGEDSETRTQDEIVQNVRDTSHLVTYLETFLLQGNGVQHRAQVFPLMGACLCYLTVKEMSMATRMSAAQQLLEALGNLHEAGIVHRDLNGRNCMWGMIPLHGLSRSAKYEALGRPKKEIIPFELWKQGDLVAPVKIPNSLCTDRFFLADFGLAKNVDDPITPLGYPPMHFCSPDRLHGKGPSFACDMWSYMVLFAELYLGVTPFPTAWNGGIIGGMPMSLGPLPEEWQGRYIHEGLDSWYDQNQTPDPRWKLESRIAQLQPEADQIERDHVLPIVSRVFTYYPEKRLTAKQLLQHSALKAIMEIYGC